MFQMTMVGFGLGNAAFYALHIVSFLILCISTFGSNDCQKTIMHCSNLLNNPYLTLNLMYYLL